MTEKVKINIDGKDFEVPAGQTIFNAAKDLGIEIPHFCYHPKLSIAGNCLLCQVEVEGARGPVISCRETVREGIVVRINSESAQQTSKDVLEFILVNHPLDCPICDQSGECKLQDQYFNHSVQPSRMQEPKIHKPKAKKIGPQVHLDDERCVLCTRCIRFCDEVVGKHQLMLRERGGYTKIDVLDDAQLDNDYSLCTVDICPVGALTSSDFRFKKRVWFLSSTPSVCGGCATGCNVWLEHHDGVAYRMCPRENEAVNQCWACDAGRMTYKDIHAENRVLFPLLKTADVYQRVSWSEALKSAKAALEGIAAKSLVGVLSARVSNEENFAFARFCKDILKTSELVWSGAKAEPEFADNILRNADRNANVRGVEMLTGKRLSSATQAKAFVVLGKLSAEEEQWIKSQNAVVIWATEHADQSKAWADVVFPRATHFEQDGTFINAQGRVQKFNKAFEPRVESLPGWQIVSRLTQAWGQLTVGSSAEDIFENEKSNFAPLAKLSWQQISAVGVQL